MQKMLPLLSLIINTIDPDTWLMLQPRGRTIYAPLAESIPLRANQDNAAERNQSVQ